MTRSNVKFIKKKNMTYIFCHLKEHVKINNVSKFNALVSSIY